MSDGFIQKGNLAPDIESNIPPDSSLIIQLELVSWRSVTVVTDDKKVLKKIVKAGEGFDRPTEGSHVKGNPSHDYRVSQIRRSQQWCNFAWPAYICSDICWQTWRWNSFRQERD